MICRDTSVYLLILPVTNNACGQSRDACEMGIADLTPNFRAS
jgi:hypothetical protein